MQIRLKGGLISLHATGWLFVMLIAAVPVLRAQNGSPPLPPPMPVPQMPPVGAPEMPPAPLPPSVFQKAAEFPGVRPCDRSVAANGGRGESLDDAQGELRRARSERDVNLEIIALNRIANVESSQGKEEEALSAYDEALSLLPRLRGRGGTEGRCMEAAALNGIGISEERLGQDQEALDSFRKALRVDEGGVDRADTLNRIGVIFTDLGQKDRALSFFMQARYEYPETDAQGRAIALNNAGWIESEMGNQQGALRDLYEALGIQQKRLDVLGQAYTLDSLGMVYRRLDQSQQALDAYNQSVEMALKAHDRFVQAHALWGIGDIRFKAEDFDSAVQNHLAALSLATAIQNPDLEGDVEASLMRDFRGKSLDTAIFFGVSAINAYQQIRRNITGLENGLQVGFARLKSPVYQELAELMIGNDQLARAEQVLDLLQGEELREVVRGAHVSGAAKLEPMRLTDNQKDATAAIASPEEKAVSLVEANVEYSALLRKSPAARTDAEKQRLKDLQSQIVAGNRDVSSLFESMVAAKVKAGMQGTDADDLIRLENKELSAMQTALGRLGPRVLGIRIVLGEQKVYALLVSAQERKRFELPVAPADLQKAIKVVWSDLAGQKPEARGDLHLLYQAMVAPYESELDALEKLSTPQGTVEEKPTLLWSLNGVLGYIPVAALNDGQHYLLERFNNVLVTLDSYDHLKSTPSLQGPMPTTLALGLSRSYGGLPRLCDVIPEMDAVVHDSRVPGSHGPFAGRMFADDQFTLARLESQMEDESGPNIVHIASHFVFLPPDGSEPYLMLAGNEKADDQGYAWTLSSISTSAISFQETKLLTLSACGTGRDTEVQDGRERESPAGIAQEKGAEAVLATLWNVDDTSTAMLMSDFYARWVAHPTQGKAEALRQAQLDLLRGTAPKVVATDPACATAVPSSSHSDYSHPFYWAPFVLMGNYE